MQMGPSDVIGAVVPVKQEVPLADPFLISMTGKDQHTTPLVTLS
jgi:hypothetical protein